MAGASGHAGVTGRRHLAGVSGLRVSGVSGARIAEGAGGLSIFLVGLFLVSIFLVGPSVAFGGAVGDGILGGEGGCRPIGGREGRLSRRISVRTAQIAQPN